MTYSARREFYRSPSQRVTAAIPSLPTALGVTFVAIVSVVLGQRWWISVENTEAPLSLVPLVLPRFEDAYQLPGVLVVGLLLVRAACLSRGRTIGSQHLLDVVGRWAWVWAAATAIGLVLTLTRVTAASFPEVLWQDNLVAVAGSSAQIQAKVATLWVALCVASSAAQVHRRAGATALLALAFVGLLPAVPDTPVALSGHGAHQDLHQLALAASLAELVAVVVWVGVLVALVVHLPRSPFYLSQVLPRLAMVTSLCVVGLGAAGLLQRAMLAENWSDLRSTDAGHLLVAQFALLILLGVVGYRHRSRTNPVAVTGRLVPLLLLVAGELVLMGATVAVTVFLTSTSGA